MKRPWAALLLIHVAASAAQHSPAVDEAEHIPAAESARLWLQTIDAEARGTLLLSVRFDDTLPATRPVVFECEAHGERGLGDVKAFLAILNDSGALVYSGQLNIHIRDSITPFRFTWDASALPDGAYDARVVIEKFPNFPLATTEIAITKLSRETIAAEIATAREAITSLQSHLPTLEPNPYHEMPMAVAETFLERAAHPETGWREAYHIARYAVRTANSLRASITFRPTPVPGPAAAGRPNLAQLAIENGQWTAGDRPVFLAGISTSSTSSDTARLLAKLNLNLLAIEDPFGPNPPTPEEVNLELAPIIRAAQEQNLSLTYIHQPPPRNLHPATAQTGDGYTPAQAAAEAQRGLSPVLERLARESHVNSVILDVEPNFMFAGEDVRALFIEWLEARYRDRNALNRIWRTRFASFDEVPIWWDLARSAYQYDWQTFHRILVTAHFTRLNDFATQAAPNLPFQIALKGDMFQPGEARYGIDRPELAKRFLIHGLSLQGSYRDPLFAMAYPREALSIVLAQSHASEKPTFALQNLPLRPEDYFDPQLGLFTHSLVWDAAIEGLDAIAVRANLQPQPGPGLSCLDQPEALEGFCRAALDLNRLAPILKAFQNAPAAIGILLSNSAKIYGGGIPHLASAVRAFEGASYAGYKVRFLTETELEQKTFGNIQVIIIPDTPALTPAAFSNLQELVNTGVAVIRSTSQIPYDHLGRSRLDNITYKIDALLVRGQNAPPEYMHALDAALAKGRLAPAPRATNPHGYTLEGVKTRSVVIGGVQHVYLLNLRRTPVYAYLDAAPSAGRDLISGANVSFPRILSPLKPMLIRMETAPVDFALGELEPSEQATIPTAVVEPVMPRDRQPASRR